MSEAIESFLLGWALLMNGIVLASWAEEPAHESWLWSFLLVLGILHVYVGAMQCTCAVMGTEKLLWAAFL